MIFSFSRKRLRLPVLFSLFLFACQAPEQPAIPPPSLPEPATASTPAVNEDGYQSEGDSMILPSFTIELKLSDKAEQKLKAANESVIVSASFSGTPKDTTNPQYLESGYVVVANADKELTTSRTAIFNGVKISKAAYDDLVDKEVEVLINVYSGRHSSPNNLLDCEMLQEPISKVRQQQNLLKGKLIGE